MNPHALGIAARKQNIGKHENPFRGEEISFTDFLLNPRAFTKRTIRSEDWDAGWEVEDRWQTRRPLSKPRTGVKNFPLHSQHQQKYKNSNTMPIKAPAGNSAPPIDAGTYQAVCYGVVSVGTISSVNSQYGPKPKVVIVWELPTARADFGDKKNQPHATSSRYTLSLGSKATLRKVLESWRGKKFTDEEANTFEIDKLIGANCLLSLVHESKGDKTYVNVATVSPLAKGMNKFTLENPRLYFNLTEALNTALVDGKDVVWPANMPEWMVTLAKSSEEYLEHVGGKSNPPATHSEEEAANQTGGDDSVPF